MRLKLVSQKIVVIFMLLLSSASAAEQVAKIATAEKGNSELRRERYVIGKSGLNRISMLPHKIIQVVGDNSQYHLKSDRDGSSIYIMPLAEVGQKIELSIRADIGQVRDLELEVASGRGRTIKLQTVKRLDLLAETKGEIKKMLTAMRLREKGKYQVNRLNRNIANDYGLKIKQVASYRYQDLTGAVLEISRMPGKATRQQLLTAAELLAMPFAELFSGVVAVSIDSNRDATKTARVFVIAKDKQD